MKRDDSNAKTLTPAGMAGMAVIGGVVGAGLALFLSDDKRRQRLTDMFTEFKDSTAELKDNIVRQGETFRDQLSDQANNAAKRARGVAEDVRDAVEEETDEVTRQANRTARRAEKDVKEMKDNAEKATKGK